MKLPYICICALSGMLLFSNPLLAHNGKDDAASHGKSKAEAKANNGLALGKPVRFRSKLTAISGVVTLAKGHADFRSKVGNKVGEDRLTAGLHIPVPSTLPAMATADQAKTFSVTLARGGVAFALCNFAFDRMSTDASGATSVELRIDVRMRTHKGTSALQNKKGTCDTDLVTAGEQQGLPAVQKGDSVSVADETGVAFLQGSF